MVLDTTGAILVPGNLGKDCPCNGKNPATECCCDECDYMLCCLESHDPSECSYCSDTDCPHSPNCSEKPEKDICIFADGRKAPPEPRI